MDASWLRALECFLQCTHVCTRNFGCGSQEGKEERDFGPELQVWMGDKRTQVCSAVLALACSCKLEVALLGAVVGISLHPICCKDFEATSYNFVGNRSHDTLHLHEQAVARHEQRSYACCSTRQRASFRRTFVKPRSALEMEDNGNQHDRRRMPLTAARRTLFLLRLAGTVAILAARMVGGIVALCRLPCQVDGKAN